MKTQIKWLGLGIVFALGCKGGGGGGGNAYGLMPFSENPQGSYVKERDTTPNDTTQYAAGCAHPGNPGATPQIDGRLKPGMIFTEHFASANGTSPNKGLLFDQNVQSVSSTNLVKNLGVIASANYGINAGMKGTETCVLDGSGGYNCKTDFSGTGQQPPAPPPDNDQYKNCNFSGMSATQQIMTAGTFTLKSGKKVSAYREVVTSNVASISCDGKDLGAGVMSSTYITTNDKPSQESAYFCGGSSVFGASKVTLVNGSMIWGFASETLDFK